jgi:hypothetical protein
MKCADKQPRVLIEIDYDVFGDKVVAAIYTDLAHEDVLIVDYTDEEDIELTQALDAIAVECVPNLTCVYDNPDVACMHDCV